MNQHSPANNNMAFSKASPSLFAAPSSLPYPKSSSFCSKLLKFFRIENTPAKLKPVNEKNENMTLVKDESRMADQVLPSLSTRPLDFIFKVHRARIQAELADLRKRKAVTSQVPKRNPVVGYRHKYQPLQETVYYELYELRSLKLVKDRRRAINCHQFIFDTTDFKEPKVRYPNPPPISEFHILADYYRGIWEIKA